MVIPALIVTPGCGKAKLLSTLAGRNPSYTGEINLNGQPLDYVDIPSHVAYVTSRPLYFPTLTVGETLQYALELRLQGATIREENGRLEEAKKVAKLHDVAENPVQFCSTFTQKCLAIACELFRAVNFLVIDDPYAGLTFSETILMNEVISDICHQLNKGVIISLASPLSHVFHACARAVILHADQVVYHGCPDRLSEYLSQIGHSCPRGTSPLEIILDLTTDHDGKFHERNQHFWKTSQQLRWDKSWIRKADTSITILDEILEQPIRETALIGDGLDAQRENITIESKLLNNSFRVKHTQSGIKTTTPLPFCSQLWTLTLRNFRNASRRILFPVSVIQNVYILTLCVLIWWRPERSEETVKDRNGLFFFSVVQWAFFALLDAILTFPKELRVIRQEREGKLYSPLAFCVAKTLSEVPLAMIQPCVYWCVIYWVANLNNVTSFVMSLGVLMLDVITAQSIGLFVGVALNPPWTVSVVSLGLLSMMLIGGAFCTPPSWLSWGKYASYFTYGLNAFITLEFQAAKPIRCAEKSMVPLCNPVNATSEPVSHFPSDVVLMIQGITWSVFDDVIVLIGIAILTRFLWFCILYRKTRS